MNSTGASPTLFRKPPYVMAVDDPVRAAALSHPDAPAIVTPTRTWSYAAFDRVVSATAERLRQEYDTPGARIAMYLPRGIEFVALLAAAIRAGHIAVPLSTRLPPTGAVDRIKRAVCDGVITSERDVARAAPVDSIAPDHVLTGDRPAPSQESIQYETDRPATIVFTSGTTGQPKGSVHSIGNHLYSARGSNQNITLAPGDHWLLSLPLYHVGGLAICFRCWLAGAAVMIPDPSVATAASIRRHAITHVSLVATQLRLLLQTTADASSYSSLQAVLLGGGPIPARLLDEAAERGLPAHTSYGLTEMASQVTTTPPGASRERLRTDGRLLPHRELRIADDGEILVRGDTLFQGYVSGGAVEDPRDADGWFHTGDVGRLDEDGWLHVEGRLDNMFVSGGENIQPEEIEQVLERVDDVDQAVVVPVSDERFGHRPVAFLKTDAGVEHGKIKPRLREQLPKFKVPDRLFTWPEGMGTGSKTDRDVLMRHAERLVNS